MRTADDYYIGLVQKAQSGERDSVNKLAEAVVERLRAYICRLTLDRDQTEDIVQETILEMFRVLGKLRKADRFWPWLYGIAFNKVRHHQRAQATRRSSEISGIKAQADAGKAGLETLITDELKQIVRAAMNRLKMQHRAVLAMRCYDEMSYSEIAESIGCSEFGARMLFCRAKRAMQKELSRAGLGKGALLTALLVFGKMTVPSEAAAATLSVTPACLEVGIGASTISCMASKTAIVSFTAVGILAVGTVVTTSVTNGPADTTAQQLIRSSQSGINVTTPASKGEKTYWYYFPEGTSGPVMMRIAEAHEPGGHSHCVCRQNEQANYYLDERSNTVKIENRRFRNEDMTVHRLPTDTPEMNSFISRIEGRPAEMKIIGENGAGLLVMARRRGENDETEVKAVLHYNAIEEEYFRYDWPAGIPVVDNRDAMHKRGWTYFRVTGQINDQPVSGTGRIPFVYATSKSYYPWLRLKVGERAKLTDNGRQAIVYDADGRTKTRYEGESFFAGLSRPWAGLHSIDTIRRDAARASVRFETRYSPGGVAEVELAAGEGKLIYTVDMNRDVIEKIKILGTGNKAGNLEFSYMQDIGEAGQEFAEPDGTNWGINTGRRAGVLWPLELVNERL